MTPFQRVAELRVLATLALWLAVAAPALPAAPVTDDQIAALREFFGETEHGLPRLSADGIDMETLGSIYAHDNAVAALHRVLTGPAYSAINERIGQLRQQALLATAAEVMAEKGVTFELNDAGKRNGGLSDRDLTLFTDATVIPGSEASTPVEIHAELIRAMGEKWRQRFPTGSNGGLHPQAFDVDFFSGAGTMQDWRMTRAEGVSSFLAQLDADISRLSGTRGVYYVPGGYKPQVYTRYQVEGRTVIVGPSLEGTATDLSSMFPNVDTDSLPDGVAIREGSTRDLSKQYENVPFVVDRTGALEAVLHNFEFADKATEVMKVAKYLNRLGAGLADLTNLEVDYRRLMLEGKDGVRRHFIEKMFGDFADRLPEGLDGLDDVHRVFEVLNRIELDKVVSGFRGPKRPGHWASGVAAGESVDWQDYDPQDINDPDVKLKYFAEEAAAIQRASVAGMGLATENRALLAEMAERAFMEKARAVAQMATSVSAKRAFNDIFTRRGFLKQQYILRQEAKLEREPYDPKRARLLLAERVRGLHTALAFQNDPRFVEAVVEAAPPEVRDIVRQIADIAQTQRAEVIERQSVFDRITEDQLRASNEPLKRLMTRLGVSHFDLDAIPHIPGQRRLRAGILADYARRNIASVMLGELVERGRGAAGYTADQAREYFRPLTDGPATLGEEFVKGFYQIGTIDQAGKVLTAFATGNIQGAKDEARDSVLGNVPLFGDVYDLFKANRDWAYKKDAWPAVTFVVQKGLGSSLAQKWWATELVGATMGHALALYGMEKSLFELGWHFVGKPTQTEAVSLALMADWSPFRRPFDCAGFGSQGGLTGRMQRWLGSQVGSSFPILSSDAMEQLQAAALLRTRIDVPDVRGAIRRELLRSQYLPMADRAARACGLPVGGARWETARDKYFATEILANWEYWLRRLYFYQQTHLHVFRWAGRHGPDWQRLDAEPPGGLSLAEANSVKAEWPSIFLPSLGGGGRWDHEEYWVRRYFERWVIEFRKAQPENGEFLYNADRYAVTRIPEYLGIVGPDWEGELLNELVRYYHDGEHLELEHSDAFAARHRDDLAAEVDSLKKGFSKMAREILDEEAPKARERQLAYEALLWSREIRERLEQAALRAAEGGSYTPPPPRLSIDLPRPVGKIGGGLNLGVTVVGDIADFPDDLRIRELSFTQVAEYQGERPAGVLRDDVKSLLDEDVEDEHLQVLVHDLTVGMESASKPAYNLSEIRRVYWIGKEPEGTVELEWGGSR